MNVFVSILGLAVLIFIHEAGHFFAALAVRMRPRGFSIGFGPPVAKITRRGIVYALRPIPLGGYVTIPGMTRPQASDVDTFFHDAVREAPELVGPAERLKRALDAEDHEAARHELGTIAEVAEAKGIASTRRGLAHVGDALSTEAYWRQAAWRRVTVIAAGPITNLVFAALLFASVFTLAGGRATTTVDSVLSGRPAEQIGIQPGDRIVEIDGHPVTRPAQITERISGSKGRPLTIVVVRENGRMTLGPVRAKPDTDGGTTVYRLGFQLRAEPLGVGDASWEAIALTGRLTKEIVKSLGNIVTKEGRDQVASPVGIVRESSTAAEAGWESYAFMLAFISLSLALLNLLPLLPLDGGYIVFAIAEKIRGRAIRREIYERVSAVGIALVLLLFFVGLSNDIGKLGS